MEEGRCPFYMGSGRFPSKTEGEGGTLLSIMTCSSLYIAKLPLSSAFDLHQEGHVCDLWVVICLS